MPLNGQVNNKARSFAYAAGHFYMSSVLGNDFVRYRQAKSRTFILGGKKGVKDAFHMLRGDPSTGIFEDYADPVSLVRGRLSHETVSFQIT